jgi:hypothetical protein
MAVLHRGEKLAIKQIDFMQKLANMLGRSLIQSSNAKTISKQNNLFWHSMPCNTRKQIYTTCWERNPPKHFTTTAAAARL